MIFAGIGRVCTKFTGSPGDCRVFRLIPHQAIPPITHTLPWGGAGMSARNCRVRDHVSRYESPHTHPHASITFFRFISPIFCVRSPFRACLCARLTLISLSRSYNPDSYIRTARKPQLPLSMLNTTTEHILYRK